MGFAGILIGVLTGRSIGLTACYGMIGIIIAYISVSLIDRASVRSIGSNLIKALEAGGKGVVIVGILLVAAQVFVSMVNLTGVGVTISSAILDAAGGNLVVVTVVMAFVCLIAGMGLPTSAAYVLVAAVFAPALISQGFDAVRTFVRALLCLLIGDHTASVRRRFRSSDNLRGPLDAGCKIRNSSRCRLLRVPFYSSLIPEFFWLAIG